MVSHRVWAVFKMDTFKLVSPISFVEEWLATVSYVAVSQGIKRGKLCVRSPRSQSSSEEGCALVDTSPGFLHSQKVDHFQHLKGVRIEPHVCPGRHESLITYNREKYILATLS